MARGGAWMELARAGNVVTAGLGVLVGAIGALGWVAPGWGVGVAALAAAFGVAGANALNDAFDVAVDRGAHPARPVPRGVIQPHEARWWGANLLVVALFLAWLVNLWVLLLSALLAANVLLYELSWKSRGLWGNILVSYNVGALFLLGGLAAVGSDGTSGGVLSDPRLMAPLVMAVLAAVLNVAREVYKDVEDVDHDRSERRTYAVVAGPRRARRLGAALAWLVIPIALAPYLLGVFGRGYLVLLVPLLLLLAVVPFLGTARTAQRAIKVGMLLGFLPFLATGLI